MATPHVSGALMLLLASEPSLGVQDAIDRLYGAGRALASLSGIIRTGRTLDVARMVYNETSPVVEPDPVPGCTYSTQEISYDPDTAADSEAIALQVDDAPFRRVDLPFAFPFAGGTATYVTISPNGVLYVGNEGTIGDYNNRSSAPIGSIAALHTDLFAALGDEGVRYVVSGDHATFFWKARHFSRRDAGAVDVRLTLYADGTVRDFVSFPDASVEAAVQSRATIGITGNSMRDTATFASNTSMIHSGLGVLFTPSCSAAPAPAAVVTSISLRGPGRGGRLVAGKAFQIALAGTGTGPKLVEARLNGRVCNDQATVSFNSGARLRGKLPSKVAERYRRVEVSSDGISSSASISSRGKRSVSGVRKSRLSQRTACRLLVRSLRQR